jgi:hypothetical protein
MFNKNQLQRFRAGAMYSETCVLAGRVGACHHDEISLYSVKNMLQRLIAGSRSSEKRVLADRFGPTTTNNMCFFVKKTLWRLRAGTNSSRKSVSAGRFCPIYQEIISSNFTRVTTPLERHGASPQVADC